MYIFDTDILVDYLRLHKPAIKLLDETDKNNRGIAFISQFELLKGCNAKAQSQKIDSFLKHFKVLPLDPKVAKKALQIYRTVKWHANIEIPDSLIAATAIENKLTLVTRNIKHYREIPALKLEKPY